LNTPRSGKEKGEVSRQGRTADGVVRVSVGIGGDMKGKGKERDSPNHRVLGCYVECKPRCVKLVS